MPTLNHVNSLTVHGERLRVRRTLEDAEQVVELILPAVVSVTSAINVPRIPGMKDILAAGKKPVTRATGDHAVRVDPSGVAAGARAGRSAARAWSKATPADTAAQLATFLKSL